jgi:hypothetical protein
MPDLRHILCLSAYFNFAVNVSNHSFSLVHSVLCEVRNFYKQLIFVIVKFRVESEEIVERTVVF